MRHEAKGKMRVKNPAKILLHQHGAFELTSPSGEVFEVICDRGRRMAFARVGELDRRARNSTTWRIRRHSEM